MSSVVIVDYNIGNVFSVSHALKSVGVDPRLSSSPQEIASADRLILPGVGAFASARMELDNRGLTDAIHRFIGTGRPFLGICVGMQLLMESSSEFGESRGLGLIKGRVDRIPATTADGKPHPVPHIAWAALEAPAGRSADAWSGTPLAPLTPARSACYFVHSFMAYPEHDEDVLAQAVYNGRPVTAAVRRDNIFGVQFHPERSGPAGQKVLRAFVTA